MNSAVEFVKQLFIYNGVATLVSFGLGTKELIFAVSLIIGLLLWEMIQEEWGDKLSGWVRNKSFSLYYFTAVLIIMSIILLGRYGIGNDSSFIYFQF